MAVSKRLRYEILRRDRHACRYCGAAAPEAKLNVDHVIPRALGGRDVPTNLVAACTSCNAGKTSSLPNAATVEDVASDTFLQAAVLKEAAETVDNAAPPLPSHDPETGMPTSWTFRQVELALVEDAWDSAWRAAAPGGPSWSDRELFVEQQEALAQRGVHIGAMLAAAVMAGAQQSTALVWGVPAQAERRFIDDEFSLGCDVVNAWESAWTQAARDRPPEQAHALLFEELSAALRAGHDPDVLLAAARAAGSRQEFYLPAYLPEPEPKTVRSDA